MALAFKRILLVTHNVQFAISTKRALESLGDYEVTTVSEASNAIERLKKQRHNLVILDVENLPVPAPEVINVIRQTQQEIAIVLAPDLPDVHDIARVADVQGVIDIPMPVRALIPVIENSVREIYDNLPETAKAPAVDSPSETVYIETLVDELLGRDETLYFTSRQVRAQKRDLPELDDTRGATQDAQTIEIQIRSSSSGDTMEYVDSDTDDRSMKLFQKLAQEEPPMPGFKENGTISDLAKSVTRSQLVQMLQQQEGTDDDGDDFSEDIDTQSQPAILVLQTALDETTPVHAISIQTLIENIQSRLPEDKQNIRPLPSWLKESKKFVTEPLFLQNELPSLDSQRPVEYTSTLTQPSDGAEVIHNPGDIDTEIMESSYSHPSDDIEDVIDIADLEEESDSVDISGIVTDDVIEETISVVEDNVEESDFTIEEQSETEDEQVADEAPVVIAPETLQEPQTEDPYLTQLAVTLTQVTTELTAEATILTRDNQIVAYSGEMPIEDIEDIREVISDDWTATADNSRIRFITLPGSGRDYMLYSKGTIGGFTLSMAFAGTKQLRVIRRQGQKLIGALEAVSDGTPDIEDVVDAVEDSVEIVPEVVELPSTPVVDDSVEPVEDVAPAEQVRPIPAFDDTPEPVDPVDVGPKAPYTFIWMVESFEIQLAEEVAQQLVFWLEVQLNSMYWSIHKLEVHQDFVYLYVDIPGDVTPSALIRNLMERSEKIVRSEDDSLPEGLWADAYLVLTPGRELTDREIQRFLNFGRGEL